MKEIYERIRYIRKNHLKVSQESFGKMLGVSRDVIKNIELNTLARPEQKEPLIKLICHEFNVDYHWLTTGEGKMFAELNSNYISNERKSKMLIMAKKFSMLEEIHQMFILGYMSVLLPDNNNDVDEILKYGESSIVEDKNSIDVDIDYISLIDKIITEDNQHAKNVLKSLNEFSIEDWEKLDKIIDLVFDTKNKIKKPND